MIVRLSRGQLDKISEVATPLHLAWFDQAERASTQMWDVPMPPIGWRTLSDLIVSQSFTPSGYRRQDKAQSLISGLRRISKRRALLEGHPGLRELAISGVWFETLLAWGDSPYPVLDREPSILVPHLFHVGHEPFTSWDRQYPREFDSRFTVLQPGEHWKFIPPVDSPGASPSPPSPGSTPS